MKLGTLTEGDLVVLNDCEEAILYVVLDVDRFDIQIREAGTEYKAEWVDISLLKKPTKKQLGG